MTCEDRLAGQLKDGERHLVDWVRTEFKKTGFKKSEFKAGGNFSSAKRRHEQLVLETEK